MSPVPCTRSCCPPPAAGRCWTRSRRRWTAPARPSCRSTRPCPRPGWTRCSTRFAPAAVETPDGSNGARVGRPDAPAAPGVAAGHGRGHRHLRLHRPAQGRGADRGRPAGLGRASRWPGSARRPGQRWLCCLPAFHIAGLQVLIRSLLAGTVPVVTTRLDPGVAGRERMRRTCRWCRPSYAGCWTPARPDRRSSTILLGGRRGSAGAAGRRPGGRRPGRHHLRDDRDLRRMRVRRYAAGWRAVDSAPAGRIQDRRAGAVLRLPAAPGPDRAGAVTAGWFATSDLGSVGAVRRADRPGPGRRRDQHRRREGGRRPRSRQRWDCTGGAGGRVVGAPDPEWGEAVTAVIVPADPSAPPRPADSARTFGTGCRSTRLRRPCAGPEIPLLPSGKPDREALRGLGVAEAQDAPEAGMSAGARLAAREQIGRAERY